ncbi:HD domain-containing protein [Modestobacter sp. VKM Ac-2977]|uniref:HD domain-containing protein n=1 Tax=Modestobacter sp. VKM Ac-2977 TaxID=3004131 RepID=UPI0022AA72D1|nr:HD domain-containing protein [Modestobacter sp. VKM Ac-2977]MCZ2820695.1 HD domain-containing protein [Modestobacter sp. VKM Ac-2977]
MTETIADVRIPDSPLAQEVTRFIRETSGDLLFHHSRRVFLFGTLQGRARGVEADPELLYVGAMCHDLGLVDGHRSTDQRFEVDGADAARDLLLEHGRSAADARAVWLAIALHTTPGVPEHLEPEIALVTAGVETDVLGLALDRLTPEQLAEVTAAHPRPDFKRQILAAFRDGFADRPDTTFGTVNDDVLAHFDPDFRRTDFTEVVRGSAWPE